MIESLILIPIMLNGNITSQEIPLSDYVDYSTFDLQTADDEEGFSSFRFAINEEVETRTKCYITIYDKSFVESTGRHVYSEGGVTTPVTRRRYYYYADSTTPKISSIITVDDSVESLVTILEEMEKDAERFGLSSSADINNAVLGYIRSMNRAYSDGYQILNTNANDVFYGYVNTSFISFCENDRLHGNTYNNYFGQFVSPGQYNSTLHSPMAEELSNDFTCYLNDPMGTTRSLDLIHFFCSIDGCYDATGRISGIINLASLGGTEKDMTSWLGDLLQACGYCMSVTTNSNYNLDNLTDFDYILSDTSSGCSYSDFLADVDAVNIGGQYLTNNRRLSTAISNYYCLGFDFLPSNQTRYYLFARIASGNLNNGLSDFENLTAKAYNYFAIEESSSDGYVSCGTFYADKAAFNIDDNPFGCYGCSLGIRSKVCTLFLDYVSEML